VQWAERLIFFYRYQLFFCTCSKHDYINKRFERTVGIIESDFALCEVRTLYIQGVPRVKVTTLGECSLC
jgi:hypothetical protein